MIRRTLTCMSVAALFVATAAPMRAADVAAQGTVEFVQSIRIPAQEAGVLKKLGVREGDSVQAGEVIAQIDDEMAVASREIAQLKVDVAEKRSKDDIEERYAEAAADVAFIDWQRDEEVNLRKPGTIPEIQLRQKRLVFHRSKLQIEKAVNDQELATMESSVNKAELAAAEMAVRRRVIRAPFDGEVQMLLAHEAEWVNPGDPVLQFVRLDNLYVGFTVDGSELDPADLQGCPVTVTARLAHDRMESVEGRVVFVDQSVAGGVQGFSYRVRAELENLRVGEFWALRPGMTVNVTIHLGH